MKIKPDELDYRLLKAFALAFPRPEKIFYGSYDINEGDMLKLCCDSGVVFSDPELIQHFVYNNYLGFFGDWMDFPAFAGDIAVYARRKAFDHEWDLVLWLFHTSTYGNIGKNLYPLIEEWVTCILSSESQLQLSLWEIHSIGYLAILGNVGGDINSTVSRNVELSISNKTPTPLVASLIEYADNNEEIYGHFEQMKNVISQQERPFPKIKNFISTDTLNSIIDSISLHRKMLLAIDEEQNRLWKNV